MDVENTGCTWDDTTKEFGITVTVTFDSPVFTLDERTALLAIADGEKLKISGCEAAYSKRKRRAAIETDFQLEAVLSSNGTSGIRIDAEDSDDGMFSKVQLLFGAFGVVAMTTLFAGIIILRKKRRTGLIESDSESETADC